MLFTPSVLDYANPVNELHPLARGLVSWWRVLRGQTGGWQWRDLMHKNHATLTNMAITGTTSGYAPTTRQGGEGEVRFDGTDDWVAVPTTESGLALARWSVGGWCFPTSFSEYRVILARTTLDANRRNYDLDLEITTGKPRLYHTEGAAAFYGFTGTTAVTLNTWSHVFGTYDGVTMALYLNGLPIGTLADTHISDTALLNTGLGSMGHSATTLFAGYLDDLTIHSRAFSATDVAALYQSSRRGHPELLRRRVPRYFSVAAAAGVSMGALAAANRHFLGTGVA